VNIYTLICLFPLGVVSSASVPDLFFQFVLVILVSFCVITLITSFYRFQILSGVLVTDAAEETDEDASNQFRVDVLRQISGRTAPPPFAVFAFGLVNQQALFAEQGESFAEEIRSFLSTYIQTATRPADQQYWLDDGLIHLRLDQLERQHAIPLATRVLEQVKLNLCRASNGWTGHLALSAACATYPENGDSMKALMEAMEKAFLKTAAQPGAVILADIPERKFDDVEEDAHDQEEESVPVRANNLVDPLTGLMRADRIGTAMQKYMATHRRESRPVSMLYIGVDHLERYETQYGEDVQETLLKTMGELLQQETRESDLLGRHGETAGLVMMQSSASDALGVARRLCTQVRKYRTQHKNIALHLTISVGVAGYPEHGRTPRELFVHTETALAAAHKRGGNTSVLYEPAFKKEKKRAYEPMDRF